MDAKTEVIISKAAVRQNKSIEAAARIGRHSCIFWVYETIDDELKPALRKHYEALGYTFKSIEYIDEVHYLMLEICW